MKISRKLLIIAGVILVILIVIFTLINSALRRAEQQNSTIIPSPKQVHEFGKESYVNYKKIAPPFTREEKTIIDKVNNTLPYLSDNLDIDFADEVNQYIVSKKNELSDEEFQKWLEERALDDIYVKHLGLFAETEFPLYTYIDLVQEFQNEEENLPDESRFTEKDRSRVRNNQLDLFTDFASSLLSFDLPEIDLKNMIDQLPTDDQGSTPDQESGESLNILPDPLPPISPKVFNNERTWLMQQCPKNKEVYTQAESRTGVSWLILAGIHYREAGCDPRRSLISGRYIGDAEPDNEGATYGSLLETAIAAANEFKGKIGGQPPKNFNELIAAAQRFHGTGGRNCGQTSLYKGPCPPPDGIDDPYPLNFFDEDHGLMYKIYCADHVMCNPPQVDNRPGVATVVRILLNN